MISLISRLKKIKWYQWAISGLLFSYLLYTALFYLYLPGKIRKIIETDLADRTGREISVNKIETNPFTLSVRITGLLIADEPDKPLLAWDRMTVNAGFWRSLFSWGIVLDELSLNRPEINIIKLKSGFNFNDIIKKLTTGSAENTKEHKQDGTGTKKISVRVFNTSIKEGAFNYSDNSGRVPAGTGLDGITLMVKEFYFATGDDYLNSFTINGNLSGGNLRAEGNYTADPLYIESSIRIDGIDLRTLSGFLENIIPVKADKGIFSLDINLHAKMKDRLSIKLSGGNALFKDLLLDDGTNPPLFSAKEISLTNFGVDITDHIIDADSIILDTVKTNQWLDNSGRFRHENLVPDKEPPVAQAETSKTGKKDAEIPWEIRVNRMSLKKGRINFNDRGIKNSRGHSLSDIDLDINGFTASPDSKTGITLSALLDEKGKISIDGDMIIKPFALNLEYGFEDIMLEPFSEYLEKTAWLKIEKGILSVSGDLSVSAGDKASSVINARSEIKDMGLKDTRSGSRILGFDAFKTDGIRAHIDKKDLAVSSVTLLKPEIFMEISADKKLNLSGLLKDNNPEGKKTVRDSDNKNNPDWSFRIDKINFQEGTVSYRDRSIKPLYKTEIGKMEFNVTGISSKAEENSPFSFNANIDNYSPFTIKGELAPITRQPGFSFTSSLKGLEMTSLSPYSAKYIGNNLKSGRLSLDLDYSLRDRKLKGENNIIARNLYLGEKVNPDPEINAPVGLGLALLRDISGVIELDVGISGDLDDPGFSVSGIIIKTLVNIFVKAAASPFKLLGALIPGGSQNLGEIGFAPGISELGPEGQERLEKLVSALNKRPQLALSIKGNASGDKDGYHMKLYGLKKQVAEKRGIELSALESDFENEDLRMSEENLRIIEKIYDEMSLPDRSQIQDQIRSENPGKEEQEIRSLTAGRIFEDIMGALKVTEEDLLDLADRRALSIKDYLVNELKLDHERVSVIKPQKKDLNDIVLKLSLEAM